MENTPTTAAVHAAARLRAEGTPTSAYRGVSTPLGGRRAPIAMSFQGSTASTARLVAGVMGADTPKDARVVDAQPGPTTSSPPV